MKTVIVGCGRVGSVLADAFDRAGHRVVVLDMKTNAFDRLPGSFRGAAVRGDGTDEDTLRRAGAEDADIFMAMTEGDNRNVMSAQLATEALGARQVIAKLNDPLRASAYAELGIATLCRTNLMASAVSEFLGLDMTFGPGISAPTGQHPGGEHHDAGDSAGTAATGTPASPASGATPPVGAVAPGTVSQWPVATGGRAPVADDRSAGAPAGGMTGPAAPHIAREG